MNRCIVALLYVIDVIDDDRIGDAGEMIDLWCRHVREIGNHCGDIRLITNQPDVAPAGIEPVAPPRECRSVADVQTLKAETLCAQELGKYDSVLYLDLDILAVSDISSLFADAERFRVGRSSIPLFDRRHAGYFMSPVGRRFRQWFVKNGKAAANTCAVSYRPKFADQSVRCYTRTLKQAYHHCDVFPLGDQTIFNWGLYRDMFDVDYYPPEWIQHSNWHMTDDVKLWHFPTANRLQIMKQRSLI
jgi:hypothetical protein